MNNNCLICKSLMFAFILSIFSYTLQAQNVSVSGGLEFPAILVGNLGSDGRIGLGATARVQYDLDDVMAITATTGYIGFLTDSEDVKLGAIPIQGGFKYYFTDFVDGVYGLGELGVHIFRSKVTILDNSVVSTNAEFSVGLGGGYEFALGQLNLDIGGRFQIMAGGGSYIGVRTALVFPVRGNSRSYRAPKQGSIRGKEVAPKTTTTKKRQGTVK